MRKYLVLLCGILVGAGSYVWWQFYREPAIVPVTANGGKLLTISSNPPLPASTVFPLANITQLQNFTHATGIFSMKVPAGWIMTDTLEGGKLAVTWVDPSKNSVISVEIFPTPIDSQKEDLLKIDKQFIEKEFELFPDFFLEEVSNQPDGSSRLVWGYNFTKDRQTARAVINRFMQQTGSYTSIVSVGFMEQHFDQLQPTLSKIINSFHLNPEANLTPKPTPSQPKPNK